jgi:hypothetical protein
MNPGAACRTLKQLIAVWHKTAAAMVVAPKQRGSCVCERTDAMNKRAKIQARKELVTVDAEVLALKVRGGNAKPHTLVWMPPGRWVIIQD